MPRAGGRGALLVVAAIAIAVRGAAVAPGPASPSPPPAPYKWRLPRGLPTPKVPADNPMSDVKVRLGRRLFYDTRLSGNGTFSCASCHQQARAFTDGRAHAIGSTGQPHARSTMSLTNAAYNASYGWADASTRTLEAQMLVPMFNEHPIEMGMTGRETEIVGRIAADPVDAALYADAFPQKPLTLDGMVKAIAAFERTLVSAGSPVDRYLYRDERDALSPAALRGMALFFSDRFACANCHTGFNLSGPTDHQGADRATPVFHNTGLYDVDGKGAYPASDRGLIDKTRAAADMGRFRAPTLRNIAVTAPYMHDGSIASLELAIAHYASGGLDSAFKSPRLKGFSTAGTEVPDLVAFLNALTDNAFLTNPDFGPEKR